jgi:hypothetical protein
MSKVSNQQNSKFLDDEMLDEYDFSQGIRGKYAQRLCRSALVTLPGIQFFKDTKGQKTSVLVDLKQHAMLWRTLLAKHQLNDFQFLTNTQNEQIAVLLDFRKDLEVWEEIYDAIVATLPGYESSLIEGNPVSSSAFNSQEEMIVFFDSMHEKNLSEESINNPPELISV